MVRDAPLTAFGPISPKYDHMVASLVQPCKKYRKNMAIMCHFLHLQIDGLGKPIEFGCFESRHQFLIDMYFDACFYITTGTKEAILEYLPVEEVSLLKKKKRWDDPKELFEKALDYYYYSLRELAIIEESWRYPSHERLLAKAAPPFKIR